MIEIQVYYGLTGIPFDKSIKSDQIFLSAPAKELGSRLEYMKQHRGLMLITGEPGTGKTTILRAFVDGLFQLSYQAFYVPLSTVNILDFYRQLNYHLGGEPLHLKSTLFRSIQKAIKDFVTHTKKIPLIIFDEAHLLKNENFFELQIVTNFNMDSTDPAIFILAAQSHLRDRLSRSFLNSFNQRIYLIEHRKLLDIIQFIQTRVMHELPLSDQPEYVLASSIRIFDLKKANQLKEQLSLPDVLV
ncbi:MAG: ATP-binding protein [bacterium]|nr:ATP-binding protein [bacterium]